MAAQISRNFGFAIRPDTSKTLRKKRLRNRSRSNTLRGVVSQSGEAAITSYYEIAPVVNP